MTLVPPGVSNVEVIQRDDDAGQATGEPRRARPQLNTAHFVRRHAMARALREIDRGDRDIEISKMKCRAPYALLTATQRNAVLDAEAQTMGDQIDQLDRMIQEGPQWCHKD